MKVCASCGVRKVNAEFAKHTRNKNGLHSWCRECRLQQGRLYDASRKEKARAYRLKRYFGISIEQYEELLAKQDNCCAICRKPATHFKLRLAVDHDHSTGEIYGLLCSMCNHTFLGRTRNPAQFLNAYEYLQKGTGLFVPEAFKKTSRKRKRKRKLQRI